MKHVALSLLLAVLITGCGTTREQRIHSGAKFATVATLRTMNATVVEAEVLKDIAADVEAFTIDPSGGTDLILDMWRNAIAAEFDPEDAALVLLLVDELFAVITDEGEPLEGEMWIFARHAARGMQRGAAIWILTIGAQEAAPSAMASSGVETIPRVLTCAGRNGPRRNWRMMNPTFATHRSEGQHITLPLSVCGKARLSRLARGATRASC